MKKLIYGLVSLALASSLAGCSEDKGSANEIAQLKEQVTKLTAENQALKTQVEEAKKAEETKPSQEPSPSPTPEPSPSQEADVIELQKALTIADFAEITIAKAAFTSKVEPPNPDSLYSYYEVKEPGNIYLDTVIKVKSLLTSERVSDEFVSVKIMYDDKYEYSSFSTIEESGGTDLTYSNITNIEPLKTGTLHYIAELPKEASEGTKPVKVIVSIQGKDYTYKMR
ncbi:hypothetical protein [Cohnella thailandensis]|uniref:hypothetical protein n=1 Tax=Cohnella thailandensis TaxID=557557 RepID=UPI001D5386FD|nr:hypothetical protein [Cohnella thailandensis]